MKKLEQSISLRKSKEIQVLVLSSAFPPQHTGSGLLIKGIINKLEEQDSTKYRFSVYCFTSREIPKFNPDEIKVNFYRTDRGLLKYITGIISFYNSFFKSDILLIINLVQPLILLAQIAALISRKKIIIEPAIQEEKLSGYIRKIYKFITYRYFFKRLSSYTPGLSQMFIDYGFNGKVYDIGAQVDLRKFYPGNKSKCRELLNLRYQGKFLFTFVGAMSERKGIDRIVRLLEIKEYNEDFLINLVGPDTEFFQNIIEEDKYGICKHINSGRLNFVLGLNDRVNEYLRSSDFLLLPTRKEAFGAVLIEALASGAIPIATRIEGVTDSFLNNSNSLLCENTFASFKETFEEALELKDKVRKEIREQGIKDAQAFSLENISSRYDKMFYDVLKND
ncbi:MAG: hypothetical protein CMC84_07880 [Flavobacteriaceae bacterium]|nr:hypothetical protein [Flavobacteriaceae bacterium]|tara:strand:- start:1227 stop:2402 length:1176 start_codon:yes stop_codon:yes gene_type:complete